MTRKEPHIPREIPFSTITTHPRRVLQLDPPTNGFCGLTTSMLMRKYLRTSCPSKLLSRLTTQSDIPKSWRSLFKTSYHCSSVVPLVRVRVVTLKTTSSTSYPLSNTHQSNLVSQLRPHLFKLKTSLTGKWIGRERDSMDLKSEGAFFLLMTWTCLPNKSTVPNLQSNWSGNSWTKEDGMNTKTSKSLSAT